MYPSIVQRDTLESMFNGNVSESFQNPLVVLFAKLLACFRQLHYFLINH